MPRTQTTGRFSTTIEPLEPRRLYAATPTGYVQTNLVSDGVVPAVTVDDNLRNPWGVSFSPTGPFWISDNARSVTTLYDGTGAKQPLTVNIPGAGGGASAPTGQVYNGTPGFVVSANGRSGAAAFIFVGEDGGISGWNPSVDPVNAVLMRDESASDSIFKGVTIANVNGQPTLLAADFHNNRIAAFDSNFAPVTLSSTAFTDKKIRKGFAPFNVQAIGNNVFVTFAKQDADKGDDVAGAGNGFVDVFNTNGKLVRRLSHTKDLNSPWGVAVAPADFGKFSNAILVGQFGSGRIVAFNAKNGKSLGLMRGTDNKPLVNPGLWALKFGNGGQAGATNALFITAGPNDEADGVFSMINPATNAPS